MAIKLRKAQEIGNGSYARVYKISDKYVVKVFYRSYKNYFRKLIQDEIEGSKSHPKCLPVLKIVKVLPPYCRKPRLALLKEYLPNEVDPHEVDKFVKDNNLTGYIGVGWDVHRENLRKDQNGNIFIVDTQTDGIEFLMS